MKRTLAVVHSYYMLLVVLQMRNTVYSSGSIDLLISDASADNEAIYHRLNAMNIFGGCYFYHMHDVGWNSNDSFFLKTSKFIKGVLFHDIVCKSIGIDPHQYDNMLVYVADRFDEQIIFSAIKKHNMYATCELYEEGYVSYFSKFGVFYSYPKRYIQIIPRIMGFIGKRSRLISENITAAWFFSTQLVQYKAPFEINSIPKFDIDDYAFIERINAVFSYNNQNTPKCANLFLEGKSFTDQLPTDDIKLLEIVSQKLGRDNVIIKLHPRTKVDRFSRLGYPVMQDNIPLELILLNNCKQGIRFITVESGAPLTCLANFNNDNQVILLYKCSEFKDEQTANIHFEKYLDEIKKACGKGRVFVPETIYELKELQI